MLFERLIDWKCRICSSIEESTEDEQRHARLVSKRMWKDSWKMCGVTWMAIAQNGDEWNNHIGWWTASMTMTIIRMYVFWESFCCDETSSRVVVCDKWISKSMSSVSFINISTLTRNATPIVLFWRRNVRKLTIYLYII